MEIWCRLEMRCRNLSQHKRPRTHCSIEIAHFVSTSIFVNTATKTCFSNHCHIRGFGICHVKSNNAEDARQLAKGFLAGRLGG